MLVASLSVCLALSPSVAPLDRRAAIGALGAAAAAAVLPSRAAHAGYVTSLGIVTTNPADAEKDDELLKTKAVQDALGAVRSYKTEATALKAKFDADTNMPLIPLIRKQFDFSLLRDSLNTVAAVFDDQTQLTVDRITRSILYDFTELENASRLKKGEETRTAKKTANVAKWFGKVDADLSELLAYF